MKNLKIISIISFLLIGGVHEKAVINLLVFPYSFVDFFGCIFNNNLKTNTILGFIMSLALLGTLIIFYKSQDKKLLILCFIALTAFSIYLSGILDHKPTIYFVVTSAIFIVSSIMLIIRSPQPLEKEI